MVYETTVKTWEDDWLFSGAEDIPYEADNPTEMMRKLLDWCAAQGVMPREIHVDTPEY